MARPIAGGGGKPKFTARIDAKPAVVAQRGSGPSSQQVVRRPRAATVKPYVHPHSFMDDALGALGGALQGAAQVAGAVYNAGAPIRNAPGQIGSAIGGFKGLTGGPSFPSGPGGNIAGGPFPGGQNAVQNALHPKKR